MSERKVLNKYYPPDYDPSKIPKLRLSKDRQYTVRLMAPFNMRCKTCGEYIYRGKKFNAKRETAQNETYLGLLIFRFYIKCPRCLAEIAFKTDPENTDYALDYGATRNFEAEKLIQEQEEQIIKEKEDEEMNNPMKVLENRTKDSRMEMSIMENLEELRDMRVKHANVDFDGMLASQAQSGQERLKQQEEEDEAEVRRIFGTSSSGQQDGGGGIKRLKDDDSDSGEEAEREASSSDRPPTDVLLDAVTGPSRSLAKKQKTQQDGKVSRQRSTLLSSLVKVNKSGKSNVGGGVQANKLSKSNVGSGVQVNKLGKSNVGGGVCKPASSDVEQQQPAQKNSLGLLSTYSDSSESD